MVDYSLSDEFQHRVKVVRKSNEKVDISLLLGNVMTLGVKSQIRYYYIKILSVIVNLP